MENSSTDNLYVIDLTYAQTPADAVFELSTVIDAEAAQNQKVFLKLGNVDLNQSQLLSINSLINSINSKLTLISSESKQTELAAATLGLLISNADASKNKEDEKPVSQYLPMTEHLDEQIEQLVEEKTDESKTDVSAREEKIEEDFEEKMMIAAQKAKEKIFGESERPFDTQISTQKNDAETLSETLSSQDEPDEIDNELNDFAPQKSEESTSGEANEVPVEEKTIQDELDSIFDSENKLENIFAQEAKNFPEAKEGFDIEIPQDELTEDDYLILKMPTKFIKQTVRSGQIIKADGNLVIIGDCHPGSELQAQGDITVWGALGGIAHAGSDGNKKARIRALQLNAIQLRIAEFFARRPDASNIVYVDKSNTVMPEEARIVNDNIVILKLND